MHNSVHGHEVIHMMLSSGKNYTRDELREDIEQRFGSTARFHTCSANNMTSDELIDFLEMRGKFLSKQESFTIDERTVCNH